MEINDQYEGYYADCYVLTNKRTAAFIFSFLNQFIPQMRPGVDNFQCFEDDTATYSSKSEVEMIQFLESNLTFPHSIYWANPETSDLRGAELFFTDDGYVICGLYCETKYPNTEIEDRYLKQLKVYCQSEEGYVTYEDTPPKNAEEFRRKMRTTEAFPNGSKC